MSHFFINAWLGVTVWIILTDKLIAVSPILDLRQFAIFQAVVMGTRRSLSVSLKDCGICGSELADYRRHVAGPGDNGGPGPAAAAAAEAASVQLACKHLFHPRCIKGWTLVGARASVMAAPALTRICGASSYADRP
jgi:hypothetical protein